MYTQDTLGFYERERWGGGGIVGPVGERERERMDMYAYASHSGEKANSVFKCSKESLTFKTF